MISRFLGVLSVIAIAMVLIARPALAERRVALIIGNSSYKNVGQLPNPANDAAAVAAMFKTAGFDVVDSRLNVGNVELRRALREFTSVARNADIAVVYYAGHGIEFDGINYLIPVDAQLATDIDVEDETVSLDRIIRMLDPVKRLRLIILDACRDNPFARKMARTISSRSVGRGLAQVEVTSTDTLVAFAAKAGMTAADGDGDHSPFTAALLDNLAVPGLDLRIAFGRVRDEVMKNTDRKQEPYVYGSIGGSTIALVRKQTVPATVVKPVSSAPSADTMVRDYEFAREIGTRQAWDTFLAAHNTGFFANLARAAREKIVAAEQRLILGQEKAAEEAAKRKAAEETRLRAAEELKLKAEAAAKKAVEEEARLKAKLEAMTNAQKTPMVVASAPNAPTTARAVNPTIDPGDLARLLQFHLKRVGCDPGALDGKWTEQSTRALQEFNKHAKTAVEVKVASIGALDAVKQQKARICPVVCNKGFKVEDDHCVAEACRRGFVRNKDGDCERETKSAVRPVQRDEGGGNRIFCSEHGGCRQLPKNCKTVYVAQGAHGSGGGEVMVCN